MRFPVLFAASASLTAASPALATVVGYNIDPSQSSLTISGDLTGNPASQQTAGSLTTSFTGTIVADRQPTKILFPGGSALDASLQSQNQQPRADATPGSAPADYGRTAPGPFSTTAFEAIRGFVADVEDDTSTLGIPISGNNFSSADLVFVIGSGRSDVIFGLGSNQVDLSNKAAANSNGNGQSSVVVSGSTETLTLKFSTGSIGYNVNQTGDSSLMFTGTIVGTRLIPEPSAAALAGVCA